MNIFYLDENPKIAAEYHCNKHVVKMIIETGQMLSTAHHISEPSSPILNEIYKPAYRNHPMSVWVRTNTSNYEYAYNLFRWLLHEYNTRYHKEHSASRLLYNLSKPPKTVPQAPLSSVPQCMPDQYKVANNSIAAYRAYYKAEKSRFAKYTIRPTPFFMPEYQVATKIDWRKSNGELFSYNRNQKENKPI
jgi:hypothetical protein